MNSQLFNSSSSVSMLKSAESMKRSVAESNPQKIPVSPIIIPINPTASSFPTLTSLSFTTSAIKTSSSSLVESAALFYSSSTSTSRELWQYHSRSSSINATLSTLSENQSKTLSTASFTTQTVSSTSNSAPIGFKYVTQEALPVQDTSFSVLPNLHEIFSESDYSSVFDQDLLDRANDISNMSNWLNGTISQQNAKAETYVEVVSARNGRPFLYTGSSPSRTKRNCYVARINDNLSAGDREKVMRVFKTLGGHVKHTYVTDRLNGCTVCFPARELPLSLLKSMTGLQWIERDQYSAFDQIQQDAPWQLSRINDAKSSLNGAYSFNSTGKGVNVYVVDSGVMVDHPEFGQRASIGFSIFNGFPNDCAGHGTQVSSVIAGTNVGVAKLANIIVAQVLDCNGQGENSSVLAALDWIISNHQKPAVVNMSVGGPKSPSVDNAVKAVIDEGISVIVAAGNSQVNACDLSPSGVPSAMVVGASTVNNERASFSNFGSCVGVFAPGRHVVAASLPSQAIKNGFTFVSGTSLSAPLVTGIYALLLQEDPSMTPAQLKQKVLRLSAPGILNQQTLLGSPNLVAQSPPSGSQSDGTKILFLPPGSLPTLGVPPDGSATLEIVLIAVSCGLGCICAILVLLVIVKRHRRKQRESVAAKITSAFQ